MKAETRSTIICVDDEKMLLNILAEQLTEWLGANYTVEKALGGEDALEILDDCLSTNTEVSVVISDYIMPNMKGDELLEKIKTRDPRIRKIMLTGYSSLDGIVSAINRAGLYRYITKPWDNRDLMLTVIEAIKSYEQEKRATELTKNFESLYHRYENLYNNLQIDYGQTIRLFAHAIDARDPNTSKHSIRVANISVAIGKACSMIESDLRNLENAAMMHDVGKIGMEDELIKKYSGLQLYNQPDIVKRQNAVAYEIIKNMNEPDKVINAAKYHWEKYDGTGVYGLKGNQIPIEARIIGIANYYDLLNSNSGAGKSIMPEVAAKIMEKTRDTHFDPMLVNVFIKLLLNNQLEQA